MHWTVKKGKKGGTTVFLCIVLSAVIFVFITYYSLVLRLDRKLEFNRAVSAQVEAFLCDYDRDLFRVYGIYAFDGSALDDTVFRMVLEENGMTCGAELVVTGTDSFDTEDLRRAITVYYSYRTTGVLYDYFADYIAAVIEALDEEGVLQKLRRMRGSRAGEVISEILDMGDTVSGAIREIAEMFDIEDIDTKIEWLKDLASLLDDIGGSSPDGEDGLDISSMSFTISALSRMNDLLEGYRGFENVVFHPYAVHYAAYNFDCAVSDHTSIDGTSFSAFHEGIAPDVEYIITGLTGQQGYTAAKYLVYGALIAKEMLNIYMDEEKMEIVRGVAEVLQALVMILTVFTVDLPTEVYEVCVLFMYSKISALFEFSKVINGENVSFLVLGDTEVVSLCYRDILFMYMNLIPDGMLLERMADIISRDREGFVCGVEAASEYEGEVITCERSYDIYS